MARESIGYVVTEAAATDAKAPVSTGDWVAVIPVVSDSNWLKGVEPLDRDASPAPGEAPRPPGLLGQRTRPGSA
jgi:hypothetical protein